MTNEDVKELLPPLVPGLEYKHWPQALVMDALNRAGKRNKRKATLYMAEVIKHVQATEFIRLMSLTSTHRYGYWSTVMELFKAAMYTVCQDGIKPNWVEVYSAIGPRPVFYTKNAHPWTIHLGYNKPSHINDFIINYDLPEGLVVEFTDPVTGNTHICAPDYTSRGLFIGSVDEDYLKPVIVTDRAYVSEEAETCLVHVLSGIRYMGVRSRTGERTTSVEIDLGQYQMDVTLHYSD